jgi:decaprenylphospho-beta-D-ribofuranose 2-oxidase
MSAIKKEELSGWGHVPVAMCDSMRPEKIRDLQTLVTAEGEPLIARGLGRAYGDAALAPTGTVRTERFDHFIRFDPQSGIVQAQAGVTLEDILQIIIPKGWLLPAIPGTRHATLGGAVACNVHGKNQYLTGELGEHVLRLKILVANGESIECAPDENNGLFWATIGGMGMTGIIEEVTLQLKSITSSSLKTLTYRVEAIEDMVAAFEHYRNKSDYMVGWIDHMAQGPELGRGVFEAANHITPEEGGAPLRVMKNRNIFNVPFMFPSFTLNRQSMALYNRWRFKRCGYERKTDIVDFTGFFHPLDGIGNWNRLYGKRGFYQYQCLFPETQEVAAHLRRLLKFIQQKKCFSFLAVIKYHRDAKGLLSFSKQGYSLALDFPNTKAVRALIPQLDRFVAERGGRVYLAKDALLSPELFTQMYGKKGQEWLELLREIDPNARFQSLMSKRLQWK